MTGKQILLTASALLLISFSGSAQVKDSISTNIRDYNDELGFYQRANRDPGDPRFMFYDETAGLNFGIGGTAKVTSYYGFIGSLSQSVGSKFRSSAISVPTDKAPVFSNGISASEIHAKARANWKGHKMIAFLRMAGADDGNVKLNQAYISIDGLSFGLIPSFFMDMEAGVMTAGIGPDAQVEHASSLVGYTHRFSKNWSFAIAAEHASLDLSHYDRDVDGVATDFQPVPDISSRLKPLGQRSLSGGCTLSQSDLLGSSGRRQILCSGGEQALPRLWIGVQRKLQAGPSAQVLLAVCRR